MPNLDAAYAALQSSGGDKAQEALLAKQSAAEQPYIDKLKTTIDSPKPAAPDLEKQPEAPKQGDFGKDAQQWTTAMSVLSALTGAFSKQHATTALNAFGAGLKGYQEGNKQAFDEAHKQWKDASEAAIENNKTLTDKYKTILDDRKLTEEEQLNGIKAVAAQYHDNLQAASTSISQSVAIYESQVKAAQTAELAHERMQLMKEKMDEKNTSKLSPAAIDEKVEAFHKGLKPADVGLSTRASSNPDLVAVMNRWADKYPNDDVAKAQLGWLEAKTEATKTGSLAGSTNMASNILDSSIPSLITIANKYGNTPSTDLNTVYNTIARHGSSEDLSNFSTQLRAVTTDYSQFIGRGRPTVHSDQEALKILHDDMGIDSLEGFKKAATIERDNVAKGIDITKANLGGGAAGPSAPAGVDPELWKHATPEEKALWQTPSQ